MSYKRRNSVKFVDQNTGSSELDIIKRKIQDYDHQFEQSDTKIRRLEQTSANSNLGASFEDRLRKLERDSTIVQKLEAVMDRCLNQMDNLQHEVKQQFQDQEMRIDRQISKAFTNNQDEVNQKISILKSEMMQMKQLFQRISQDHKSQPESRHNSEMRSQHDQRNQQLDSQQSDTQDYYDRLNTSTQQRQSKSHHYQNKLDTNDISLRDQSYIYAQDSNKNSDYKPFNNNTSTIKDDFVPSSKIVQDKKRLIDEEINRRLKEEDRRRSSITGPVENAQQVSIKQNQNRYSNPIHTTQKARTTEISNRLSLERKMKQDKISMLEQRANYKNDYY